VKLAVALAVVASCDRRAPIASCDQDLTGTYVSDGKRWIIQDHGDTLEAFPLFADIPAGDPSLEIAPRVIDLVRLDDGISGAVRRRYMRGPAQCHAKIPVRITACAGDTLDVLLADPVPPLQFEGPIMIEPADDSVELTPRIERRIELFAIAFTWRLCAFPRPDANRRERWVRE
jgi:hypothetical protein